MSKKKKHGSLRGAPPPPPPFPPMKYSLSSKGHMQMIVLILATIVITVGLWRFFVCCVYPPSNRPRKGESDFSIETVKNWGGWNVLMAVLYGSISVVAFIQVATMIYRGDFVAQTKAGLQYWRQAAWASLVANPASYIKGKLFKPKLSEKEEMKLSQAKFQEEQRKQLEPLTKEYYILMDAIKTRNIRIPPGWDMNDQNKHILEAAKERNARLRSLLRDNPPKE